MAPKAKRYTKNIEIKENFEEHHREILAAITAYTEAHPDKPREDIIRDGIPLTKKLRKAEQAWVHNNMKDMWQEEVLSSYMACIFPPPKFKAGQAIHYYWAGWMDGATEVPLGIKKGQRGKWYVAEICNPPSWDTVTYGGRKSTGWTYMAH